MGSEPTIDTAATRWRRWARAVALPAAVAFAIVAATAGCGGSSGETSSTTRTATVADAVHHHGAARTATTEATTTATASAHSTHTTATHSTHTTATHGTHTTTGARAATPHPRARTTHPATRVRPTTVALVRRTVAMRSAPGHRGHVLGRLKRRTQFGSSTAVPVMVHRGGWLGVLSLVAGNNRLGWIPRSAVSLSHTSWRIYLSLARQRITVTDDGRVVKRIRTSTGVPGAITPSGHFAVTDRLRTGVQDGPYGCCILALSAVQPLHLSDWAGGDRIAIHGTVDVADLGRPASHGCAHVDDVDGRWLLAHIPDGTPVVIENAPFHPGRGSPA